MPRVRIGALRIASGLTNDTKYCRFGNDLWSFHNKHVGTWVKKRASQITNEKVDFV